MSEPVVTVRRLSYAEFQQAERKQAQLVSLRGLDTLAYDKTSSSPTQGSSVQSLLKDRHHKLVLAPNGIVINPKDVITGKAVMPFSPAWIAARSDKHGVLLATAKLCPCCGYRDCLKPVRHQLG